jgi:hypothetical protein
MVGNQRAMYEVVKALITETSIVKFSVITIQQNFILLPNYMLHKLLLLPTFLTKLAILRNWLLCSFGHRLEGVTMVHKEFVLTFNS